MKMRCSKEIAKKAKTTGTLLILCIILSSLNCSGQEPNTAKPKGRIGGPCEGCEAIYEYGDKKLTSIDTLPGFQNNEPKTKNNRNRLSKRW